MTQEHWAADTSISMPEPPSEEVLVDFEGFGFSMNGIVHNLSTSDLEEMQTPTFSPEGFLGEQDGEGRLGIEGDNIDVDDDFDPGMTPGAEYDIEVWNE